MRRKTQFHRPISLIILFCGLILLLGQSRTFAFVVGAQVQATGTFNIRQTPAGTILGTQSFGARGTVIGGPTVAVLSGTSYTWWNVDFVSGTDGWIADTGLTPPWARGLDVYHDNGAIDWAQVKAAGMSFAFIKSSEGLTYKDTRFVTYMRDAKAAGMLSGAYHFAHPLKNPGTNGAIAEANYFLSIGRPYVTNGWLPPSLDIEDEPFGTDPHDPCSDGTTGTNTSINLVCKLGKAQLSEWVRAWVNEVKRQTGVTPVLYMNRGSATNGMEADLGVCPLWLAYFKTPPDLTPISWGPWTNGWTFLQYSFTNSISGVSIPTVDFNLFTGDENALQLFAAQVGRTNIIPPVLTGIDGSPLRPATNGVFKFQVSSASQPSVIVQASDNLTTWTNVGTAALSHSHATFTDSNVGAHAHRFYRPKP